MIYRKYLLISIVLTAFASGSVSVFAQRGISTSTSGGTNTIEGLIFDESRRPVYNAFIELTSNLGALMGRQRSSSQGRFTFRGIPAGRYTVTVKPFGTNLLDDTQEVEVRNEIIQADTVFVDFRLKIDNRFSNEETRIVGTVFAQDVPDEAKRLYKSAIENIDEKHGKALLELEEAVKVFPTYFDALAALGKAYILDSKYEKGYPFLLRAVDINTKCSDCYYSLGLAFYKLDEIPAGIKAVEAAMILSPAAPEIHLLRGILYRISGDLPKAESSLFKARSLYKKPNAEVHWQLSLLYNRLKRDREAADELEGYLKAKPDIKNAEKQQIKDLILKLRKTTLGN